MVEMRKPIEVSEAVKRIVSHAKTGEVEAVHINDAYGRVLGEAVIASHPVPPFDRSPYDGFAIRSQDTKAASRENQVAFKVIETIGAGYVASKALGPFETIRIMTGAQLPKACDAVVKLELTSEFERSGEKYMTIHRPYASGENVSFQGEDTEKNTVIVKKGERITPGVMAVLATFGYEYIKVAKKPIVAVFATGSELLDISDALQPGKIRNSNALMICSQIKRAGGTPKYLGTLKDDLTLCYASIQQAMEEADMIITTGGVSVGDFDYLPDVYRQLGAEVLFNKVAMRPGSVTTVALCNEKYLFGLSGNPSASFIGFELFVRPVIRTWLFSEKPHLRKGQAILGGDFLKPNPFTRFVGGKLCFDERGMVVVPSHFTKSNAVVMLSAIDALIVLPGRSRDFKTGDKVNIVLLEDLKGSEWPWT
ncbi:molybdopterin molybdenumtransferase [Pullulanibacillus camelliae]|uniref:Molybdopterin molybdenumtransferase n=1 Tax=Pullulanibacillus camelliae TaxID=1707096 RepID=A0A8J2YL94_9BACL|nr:gephyrin-like molybdotransferase Glp [Pullulanibacillus camelliae]GGE50486.1 molybdopterin molybdenumtransferase [Pullulanibacillus camelliae]